MPHFPHYAALSLIIAACPRPSTAAEVAPLLKELGVLGTWAKNCQEPPSRQNPRYTWAVEPDGAVRQRNDLGADAVVGPVRPVLTVVDAQRGSQHFYTLTTSIQHIQPDGTLVRLDMEDKPIWLAILTSTWQLLPDNKRQIWRGTFRNDVGTRTEKTTNTVVEGIAQQDQSAAPILEKCE